MLIKKLAKQYNIRVIYKNFKVSGCAFPSESLIVINKKLKGTDLISIFLHEVGHIEAYRQKKYVVYHSNKDPNKLNKKNKHIFKSTAYPAELWVDNWAEKEFIKLKFNGKYCKSYGIDSIGERQFLKAWFFS